MPPQFLFDLTRIDLGATVLDQEAIRQLNPHRGDMEHLNGVIWVDTASDAILGYKDVRADEFWVAGHIPGRPILPGVLMIEAAAQLSSVYMKKYMHWDGFIGFGGVADCKFRNSVIPPAPGEPPIRMHILCRKIWERHKRCCSKTQGVVNGNLIFESEIVGVTL